MDHERELPFDPDSHCFYCKTVTVGYKEYAKKVTTMEICTNEKPHSITIHLCPKIICSSCALKRVRI